MNTSIADNRQLEQKMLADAICCGLEDLLSDVRSPGTQSSELAPQVRDLYRMAQNLRSRIANANR